MSDHVEQQQQQLQQQMVQGEEAATGGTPGDMPREEEVIDISLGWECNNEVGQWHDSEDDETHPEMDVNPPPHAPEMDVNPPPHAPVGDVQQEVTFPIV